MGKLLNSRVKYRSLSNELVCLVGCWRRLLKHISPMLGLVLLLVFLSLEVIMGISGNYLARDGFQLTRADMMLMTANTTHVLGLLLAVSVVGILLLSETVMTKSQWVIAHQGRRQFLFSQLINSILVALCVSVSVFVVIVLISHSYARFDINFQNKGSFFTAMTGVTKDVSLFQVEATILFALIYLTSAISLLYSALRWITNSGISSAIILVVFIALMGSGRIPGFELLPDLYLALYEGILPCSWTLGIVCLSAIFISCFRIKNIDFLDSLDK